MKITGAWCFTCSKGFSLSQYDKKLGQWAYDEFMKRHGGHDTKDTYETKGGDK